MRDPERILLVRPSALGDVCRTVPVLASLRARYPDARIDWLVQDTFADAVRHHRALSDVVPFPRGELGKSSKRLNFLPTWRWAKEHLRGRYDVALDAQGLFRSALFARAAAPVVVGDADAREGAHRLYTRRVKTSQHRHTVDRMLALLEGADARIVDDLTLHADAEELAWVEREGLSGCVVFAPTSRWRGKQWPDERFAKVARQLVEDGLAKKVVLVGGPGEREQTRRLSHLATLTSQVIDLIGETSIARLMALIARSRLVVANDSAALHMAVGFDRPAVALYGPTRVDLVGPYCREADVIQRVSPGDTLDHKDDRNVALMQRIRTEEVLEACAARLRRQN